MFGVLDLERMPTNNRGCVNEQRAVMKSAKVVGMSGLLADGWMTG